MIREQEPPFTPSELAERWKCARSHVNNLLNRGDLSGFRLGKEWRIPAHVVREIEACGLFGTKDDGQSASGKTVDGEEYRCAPTIVPSLSDA